MSLPITAVGPLNVLMNPIFTDCWAIAGDVASAARATVPMKSLFITAVLQRRVSPRVFAEMLAKRFAESAAILVDRDRSQKPS
jgi:hypothetical protein